MLIVLRVKEIPPDSSGGKFVFEGGRINPEEEIRNKKIRNKKMRSEFFNREFELRSCFVNAITLGGC